MHVDPTSVPAARGDRRRRLRIQSFFRAYAPGRLDQVGQLAAQYRGQEERLFSELVRTYGPEPPMPADAAIDDDEQPSASVPLAAVALPSPALPPPRPDKTMAPIPTAGAWHNLRAYETARDQDEDHDGGPATAAGAPGMSTSSAVEDDDDRRREQSAALGGWGAMVLRAESAVDTPNNNNNRHPSSSAGGGSYDSLNWEPSTLASLLVAYYGTVDPSRVAVAPRQAALYFGGRELELFEQLASVYGVSPLSLVQQRYAERRAHRQTASSEPVMQRNGVARVTLGGDHVARERVANLTRRLVAFYEEVNPDRVSNAGQLAQLFGGSEATEEQLLRRLEAQYGKRPAPLTPAIKEADSSRDPSVAPSAAAEEPEATRQAPPAGSDGIETTDTDQRRRQQPPATPLEEGGSSSALALLDEHAATGESLIAMSSASLESIFDDWRERRNAIQRRDVERAEHRARVGLDLAAHAEFCNIAAAWRRVVLSRRLWTYAADCGANAPPPSAYVGPPRVTSADVDGGAAAYSAIRDRPGVRCYPALLDDLL